MYYDGLYTRERESERGWLSPGTHTNVVVWWTENGVMRMVVTVEREGG